MKRTLREATSWTKSRDRFVYIRKLARQWIEEYGVEKKCVVCNFDVVVEVCHIKPITSFDLDSTLAEINAQDNLVYLCPNHHVMFDKGILKLNNALLVLTAMPSGPQPGDLGSIPG